MRKQETALSAFFLFFFLGALVVSKFTFFSVYVSDCANLYDIRGL